MLHDHLYVFILQQTVQIWPNAFSIRSLRCNVASFLARATGAVMSISPVCFLKGTRIWTPHGERKVEDLRINDLVVTSSGEAKPIQWVWGRRFERQYGQKWPEEIAPIRVAPSALGPNTPHRELFLSRYHCLYLDGVLIPVVDLLNSSTITRGSAEDLREIEYFHFKLERHSVIYAEGAACETLRAVTAVNSDIVEFEEYRRLYGESSLPDEPAAPMLGYNGGRARLRGRIRSAVSHVIDVRSKLEIVRDELRERARCGG
jgi:Hint domain